MSILFPSYQPVVFVPRTPPIRYGPFMPSSTQDARFERYNKCNDLRLFFSHLEEPKYGSELTLTPLDEGIGQFVERNSSSAVCQVTECAGVP